VVYDTKGIYSSKGVVVFKVMGHEKVWVLDGGLPAWIKEGCY
jgi:thiosulfate/3-mercaptopyruvate sulfurtransferase